MRLGDVATYVNGYAFKPSDYSADGLPIIRIQNLTGNVYETNRFSGTLPEKFKVANGDILISWSASLGVYRWSHGDAWLNQHIFKVVFDKLPVNVDFFVYQAGYLIENSANLAHGATMRHLTKKVFDSRPFYYPSSAIQARIARNLASIDVLLGSLRCQLSTLDDLVKSQFVEMFGNVSATCRVQDVATTYNGDRGKNYPTADDKVLAGYPFINAGNLEGGKVSFDSMDYITAEKYQTLSGGKIRKDDILYCLRGSLGKSAICDFDGGTIASSLMVIRANIDEVSPRYLFEALNTPDVIRQMHAADNGSSQPNLSAKSVKSYLIPLPSKELQQQFADFVARVDKLGFDCCREIVCCGVLFSSMSASLLCT